ncbi:unnamed protein product, partial [Candidula unifasciata]
MPGKLLAQYCPARSQTDAIIMNGGFHHAPGNKSTSGKTSHAANFNSGSRIDDQESAADPSQIRFLPKPDGQTSRTAWNRWSGKEKCLMLLSTFLFLLCVTFIVVAFTRDLHFRNQLR